MTASAARDDVDATAPDVGERPLTDELLARVHDRAAGYDEANAFFAEDLADLRAAGYLGLCSPAAYGGAGATLRQTSDAQRRLAAAAPATALGINMHLVWTSVARILADRGIDTLDFVLREAAAGELFAFGVSEPGNDLMLFDSVTTARRESDGGYRYTGRKIFTSLSPAWTRLGVHGREETPHGPRLVWGFLDRADGGTRSLGDWNTLGMRASQSHTTELEDARVRPDRIVATLPVGPVPDPLIFAIFAAFEVLLASVYAGIAERAVILAIEAASRRTSRRSGAALDQDPDTRYRIAEAQLLVDGMLADLTATAQDVDRQVDHGPRWFSRLSGVKVRVTRTTREVVDLALAAGGGAQFTRTSELSRLYRDVAAGAYHPSSDSSAHATMATALLGPLA
ncbi:acyl-CoA dehydrogenase family protein [Tersicoccus sp. Bi-70]|uniref:acyl-CoA dehydrogenase family protein n=1 Tax=Tersicoccus sp. Bi-70 TaxID=1897634 RepID=UPI0009780A2A|nr:acyl-CoA dehydrogenase family protein [Tersicoccus sp. Bi-70]OMH33025.1 acyl-CoA dehydrogenase [Tersicoccus sp. Bi-70]